LPRGAAATGPERGLATTTATPKRRPASHATPTPTTRAVYRLLLVKGLDPAEASALTAFMCGLPTSDLHWSLEQVNQLLFLRRLRQLGRFGDRDGRSKRPH
jgi:hypothetical protein